MQSQRQLANQPAADALALPPTAPRSVWSDYQPVTGAFDELHGPITATTDGTSARPPIRPVWTEFCQRLNALGAEEFGRRWNRSQRLIYENGISYSPYGDPQQSGRLWRLDALPLLIAADEWQVVAAGIAQRANLWQMVLADLLGPQRVIKEGIFPAALLFGHPEFQLPYLNLPRANQSYIHFYAGDLGRAPDGRWWLLGDRSESPSGVGFALENRVVISRMLPEVYRASQVQRLAPFFVAIRDFLHKIAPTRRDNPRVVLLSRGPAHESYFEDAYLARYLGYTLVEGGDLAVRHNAVYLKTLDGLLPVDVILRRPNSNTCDPLEFSGNAAFGPAGLLQATRHASVSICNPLGSGLIESPAFMAFAPRLARFFLSSDLLLPGLATYWCGEPKSLSHVLAHLDKMIVRPAFRRRGRDKSQDEPLRNLSRDELKARIETEPTRYVAQERFQGSTAPTWREGRATPRQVVLRAFALSHEQSYTVMQGGLARTSPPETADGVAIPEGVGCKDAWVISDHPVEPISLLRPSDERIALRRSGSDLPSRVADNIGWLGRQIERADATARLLRTVILQLTSETSDEGTLATPTLALLRAMAAQGQIEPGYSVQGLDARLLSIDLALPQLVFDGQQPGTLRSVTDELFRLASLVRDRLSMDTWRIMVHIDQQFHLPDSGSALNLSDVLGLVNRLIVDLAALEGMAMESMTRSHVFRFLDMGRRLERALQTTALVRSCFFETTVDSPELLEAALEISDSLMTYRARYLANLHFAAVLDLLLTDETNPRSVAYQLATLESHLQQLPRQREEAVQAPHARYIMSMRHALRMIDIQAMCDEFRLGNTGPFDGLLTQLESELPLFSDEIWRRYLVHAGTPRKMSVTSLEP